MSKMTRNTRKKRQTTRRMHKNIIMTRKSRGGTIPNDIKKCKATFLKKTKKVRSKKLKELSKVLEKQVREKFVNNPKELKEKLNEIRFTKLDKKSVRIADSVVVNANCNPGCKNTILEPGKKLPARYYELFGKDKKTIRIFEKERKSIFGNKTNVLKENFYEKAPKKFVDDIKKDGAISLCSPVEKMPLKLNLKNLFSNK
jgi:anion-transporting  ArsA/GET3 family ATPase